MLTSDQREFCLVLASEVATEDYNIEALANMGSESPKLSDGHLRDALYALGDVSDCFPYPGCPDRAMINEIKRILNKAV